MDHILSLPRSFTEIRELLIKIDLISKYVVSKASASRTAQIIAQNYIEWLFRWFGSSEAIRQDRKPGFISDFVRALIRIVGHNSKQLWRIDHKHTAQRNLGYRRWPERSRCMCQSRNQIIGMNVPNDWHTRLGLHMIESAGTLHFFIYNWDRLSTLEATSTLGSTASRDRDTRRWRYGIQRHYQRAKAEVNSLRKEAIQDRTYQHNQNSDVLDICSGRSSGYFLIALSRGTLVDCRICGTDHFKWLTSAGITLRGWK